MPRRAWPPALLLALVVAVVGGESTPSRLLDEFAVTPPAPATGISCTMCTSCDNPCNHSPPPLPPALPPPSPPPPPPPLPPPLPPSTPDCPPPPAETYGPPSPPYYGPPSPPNYGPPSPTNYGPPSPPAPNVYPKAPPGNMYPVGQDHSGGGGRKFGAAAVPIFMAWELAAAVVVVVFMRV
ncbi:hypothetical protein ACLOJK_001999 [Asimina triloba]